MNFPIQKLPSDAFPKLLLEIPKPPRQLNYRGTLPPSEMKLLSVVGSRKYTDYGKQVVDHLIAGLRGHNIGIVSGLALGIDSLAHKAALQNGIYTLAIPGGGLSDEVIYPKSHLPLARKILAAGGGLLSEFEPDFRATPWSFPQRNRLVAGIADATLIIEAGEKSGSLITARLCADYNRELLVVPGSIFSDTSRGVHQFLKLGATPVTDPEDILDVLGLKILPAATLPFIAALSPEEKLIIEALQEPCEREILLNKISLPATAATIVLTQMEINGHIIEQNGVYRKISSR